MTPKERQQKLALYGQAYELLVEALSGIERAAWHFKPSDEEWSIHEVVVHITDSEANSYIRCRRFLAEPGEPLMAYDEGRWAHELRYTEQDPALALELFKWLRKASFQLIEQVRRMYEGWQRAQTGSDGRTPSPNSASGE